MRVVTERTEIAKVLNSYREYPVIELDLSNRDSEKIIGPKVLVAYSKNNEPVRYVKANADVWYDEGKLSITQGAVGIKSSFGYSDIREMLDYANAPILRENSKVVVVVTDSLNKQFFPPVILDLGKVQANSVDVIDLEYKDFTMFFKDYRRERSA